MKGYGVNKGDRSGSKSVATASAPSKKNKTLSIRLSQQDRDVTERLALQLKELGYQYSAGDAVRVALRLFNAEPVAIAKVAEELKLEDGRRK